MGQLSGGERQRVILAIKIAYNQFVGRKTGIECNLLVLDEVRTVATLRFEQTFSSSPVILPRLSWSDFLTLAISL